MQMIETFEQGLVAIMKTFHPSRNLLFGEKHYRVISGILDVVRKESFLAEQLIIHVNEQPLWSDHLIEATEIREVLDMLQRNGLIIKDPEEKYKISEPAIKSLSEFFTLYGRPRGRTGFMRYLLQSKQRTIQWCCIYLGNRSFDIAHMSKLSGLDISTCKMFLERLASKHQLRRDKKLYRIDQEREMIKELIFGYEHYQYTKPTIKDTIIEIMLDHDKMSGKEIYEHLKLRGILCNSSTIYTHLKNLENEGMIGKIGQIERRAIPEKYYALNYEDVELYKKELLKQIQENFAKVGIIVKNEFFKAIAQQDPHRIRVFLRQLFSSIAVQDEHDYSSWHIWTTLEANLVEKDFLEAVSKFLSVKSAEQQENMVKNLVEKYNISPALLAVLLIFQHKKTKPDDDQLSTV